MTRPDLTGVMLIPRSGDGKRYEYFGYVQIGGAMYKFTAWRNPRSVAPCWDLMLKPHQEFEGEGG